MRKRRILLLVVVALLALPLSATGREYSPQEEERLGQEGAAEVEREFKVLEDPEQLKRVTALLNTIAPVTERPNVTYKAKILDTPDVNAFSLPGGLIYVTRGLLETVGSDAELAGVLAHEIAHNAHRHALRQLDKSERIDQKLMLVVIPLLVLGRDGVDPETVLLLGQMVKANALQGYGLKAELDADRSAVEYLIKTTSLNPVGVYQFMSTLERKERLRPYVEMGIFRTHPMARERVEALRGQLAQHGIPLVPIVTKYTPVAKARPVTVDGQQIAEVVLKDQTVFQPASPRAGKSPMDRAEDAARRVSEIFYEDVEERYVTVAARGQEQVVLYRLSPLITVTPEDARFHNTSAEELARRAAKAIKKVIWSDFVQHRS